MPDLRVPAIVSGTVRHRRRSPVAHAFEHTVHLWLVDLDDVPRLPWYLRPVASFRGRDHFAAGDDDPARIRHDLDRFLDENGQGRPGRVLMLAGARFLGHVFDPLTVYWCYGPEGTLRCVVAEVHNTYGGRHAYLLAPDAAGVARTDKRFYVSPFNDVSGRYTLQFTLRADLVRVDVSLAREAEPFFDASFEGVPEPATRPAVLRTALRRPAMPQRISVLIRLHGIYLWLRRLPVVPRPEHLAQKGSS